MVPYGGPVQIKFANRTCITGALLIAESVLMAPLPMEDMDLVVSPSEQTVTVNSKSPKVFLSRGEVEEREGSRYAIDHLRPSIQSSSSQNVTRI